MNVYMIVQHEKDNSRRGRAKMVRNPNWDDNWQSRFYPDGKSENVDAYPVYEVAECGDGTHLWYFWELSGPGGAWFMLFAEPSTTKEQIAGAKAFLRRTQDVTGIAVFRITEWAKRAA